MSWWPIVARRGSKGRYRDFVNCGSVLVCLLRVDVDARYQGRDSLAMVMNYDEWFTQHFGKHGQGPIPRDERGLVTPMHIGPTLQTDELRIKSQLHNVTEDDFLRASCEKLCKRGSWCKDYDCFSYISHGGLRHTLVMYPDGVRYWVTTKTRWDPTSEETAAIMSWRMHSAQLA